MVLSFKNGSQIEIFSFLQLFIKILKIQLFVKLGLKLNIKITLNHHHHHPPQTFLRVLGFLGG